MEKKKNKKIVVLLSVVIVLLLAAIIGLGYVLFFKGDKKKTNDNTKSNVVEKQNVSLKSEYSLDGNNLDDFDLAFLKLENSGKNNVYSPLSIKYALEMLAEGAEGDTKTQLDSILGKYETRKYENTKNMSFANALFVKDSFKNNIKREYESKVKNKYNADVVYDTFETSNNLNKWVSDKTLGLIDNLFDKVDSFDYILVNALGIDMDWVHTIQGIYGFDKGYRGYNPNGDSDSPFAGYSFSVNFTHEDFSTYISPLLQGCYSSIKFNVEDSATKVTNDENIWPKDENGYQAVKFAAVANRYDIVNTIGLDNMKKTITEKYTEYYASHDNKVYDHYDAEIGEDIYKDITDEDITKEVNEYIETIGKHYGFVGGSTDFRFYDDENVKVFAKELKEYNGVTLEYVGIMPKVDTLKDYINKLDASKINEIIGNLKSIELDSFEDGYITEIIGYMPLFKIDNDLDLIKDLKTIGVTDVFDSKKADLSNISDTKTFTVEAKHSANIEFTNEGIKAAAAIRLADAGDLTWDIYKYEVPKKVINLTFDNPFMYLVRNKNTGEVWFMGTVYEPNKYDINSCSYSNN